MSVEKILTNLKKVKRTGNAQWMGCCPAHDDRDPSLSIKDMGDGRIVLKCFAGCETINVLNAIGLDWEDVMPEKQKIEPYVRPTKHTIYATDAIKILRNEARIIVLAAMDIQKGVQITAEDLDRVKLAMTRINNLEDATHG